jgi:hypothetical protein
VTAGVMTVVIAPDIVGTIVVLAEGSKIFELVVRVSVEESNITFIRFCGSKVPGTSLDSQSANSLSRSA